MGDGAMDCEGSEEETRPYPGTQALYSFTRPWSHTGKNSKLKFAWGTMIFLGFVLTRSPMQDQSYYGSHLT